jgi:hypothetical protein
MFQTYRKLLSPTGTSRAYREGSTTSEFSDLALGELQLEPGACMEIRMRYLKRLEGEVGSLGMVQSTL